MAFQLRQGERKDAPGRGRDEHVQGGGGVHLAYLSKGKRFSTERLEQRMYALQATVLEKVIG